MEREIPFNKFLKNALLSIYTREKNSNVLPFQNSKTVENYLLFNLINVVKKKK